jgi:hypothetical protein
MPASSSRAKKRATPPAKAKGTSASSATAARTNLAEFREVLAGYSPAIVDLALQARALIVSVLPEVFEVVWTRQKTTGYGTGPKKMTEHFCWIQPASKHVTLGFNYGGELPDPAGLLEGTGKSFRHVKLASRADLDRKAVRAIVIAATKHRVPAPTPL